MRILFATSELYPWVKTGGLADVSHSLPDALAKAGHEVVVILPNYAQVREKLGEYSVLGSLEGFALDGGAKILEVARQPGSYRLWLVDAPALFDRAGGPYVDASQQDWPDNPWRFAFFARAIYEIASGHAHFGWRPELVHCNDWQTGLVPALLSMDTDAVPTVMTIHNLAYQGVFGPDTYRDLLLPDSWWHMEGVEYYGNFSFLKAGLVYSQAITTVSPTYAEEIQTDRFGHGMQGVLRKYHGKLQGILNGVDYQTWSPELDKLIKFPFSAQNLAAKLNNKLDLQREFDLALKKQMPLVGVISRLAHQKGIDLIERLAQRTADQAQWIILGSGDPALERRLLALEKRHPKQIQVSIGYDESLAHRIEAGADVFMMPSRYEPCGLNQMYSLRYGTVPVVHAVGGLADTVTEVSEGENQQCLGTGFRFASATVESAEEALRRALSVYHKPQLWQQIQRNGMAQDFSWGHSANRYEALYSQLINN